MMRSEAFTSSRRLTGAKRLIHDKEDDEHISEVTRLIKRVTLSAHAARLFEIRVLAGCPGGQMMRHFTVAASRFTNIAHFHYICVEDIRNQGWNCPQTMDWLKDADGRFVLSHPQQGLPSALWNLHTMEDDLDRGLVGGIGYPANGRCPIFTQVMCYKF